jgi:MFS family permease
VLALDRSPANQLWRSALHPVEILLGIIAFATALGEGAANDWLALMLVDNRGAPPAVGALTFAGFNLTMAIGRFSSGVVIQRYGRAPGVASSRHSGLYWGGRAVSARRPCLGARTFRGVPFSDLGSHLSFFSCFVRFGDRPTPLACAKVGRPPVLRIGKIHDG